MFSWSASRKVKLSPRQCRRLERQLGREINYTILTRKELDVRRARKDPFLENVWHNKRISLVGAV